MIEDNVKGVMDAREEAYRRDIEANAVLINDRLFFSKFLHFPEGKIAMVCGLRAYYCDSLPERVLFAVTHVPNQKNPRDNEVDVDKAMEFIKSYAFTDDLEVYTNGAELVPLFRVKQALRDKAYNGLFEEG